MTGTHHLLGYCGLGLMLFAQFAYTWRKRPRCVGPFSMQTWLIAHATAGLLGVVLTLLHARWHFAGLAGAAQAAAIVVVAAGFYGSVPHSGRSPRRSVWYVLHVPFSVIMLLLFLAHIAGVIYYGAGWL